MYKLLRQVQQDFIKAVSSIQINKHTWTTGTTIVAAITENTVVLGADRQMSMGFMKEKLESTCTPETSSKIVSIAPHLAYQICGAAAAIPILKRVFTRMISTYRRESGSEISPVSLARWLSTMFERAPTPYFTVHIAGLDPQTKQPQVITVMGDGFLNSSPYMVSGSGTMYAKAIMADKHRLTLTTEELVEVVKAAVHASTAMDMGSGYGIDISTITQSGYTRYKQTNIQKLPGELK